jgi:hypothetical protein
MPKRESGSDSKSLPSKLTGVYLPESLTNYLKIMAAAKQRAVSDLVSDALKSYFGFQQSSGGSTIETIPDIVASLKAELITGISVGSRPANVIDDRQEMSPLKLFRCIGWSLNNLLTVAFDRLYEKVENGCRLELSIVDPEYLGNADINSASREATFKSLVQVQELLHRVSQPELVEIRFHQGLVNRYSISKTIDSVDRVRFVLDFALFDVQSPRLRIKVTEDDPIWTEAFNHSVDGLWEQSRSANWEQWLAQFKS